jgi:hypothetical protein
MYLMGFCFNLIYIGGYDKEEKAARAYDLAALKYWGTTTTTNFPVSFHFLFLFFNKLKEIHMELSDLQAIFPSGS